jgi:hypothetical protein
MPARKPFTNAEEYYCDALAQTLSLRRFPDYAALFTRTVSGDARAAHDVGIIPLIKEREKDRRPGRALRGWVVRFGAR